MKTFLNRIAKRYWRILLAVGVGLFAFKMMTMFGLLG